MKHRQTLDLSDLTPAGLLRRRNECCQRELGINFVSLVTLVATVVRWCCHGQLLSGRADLARSLSQEDDPVADPRFDQLRSLGLVEVARTDGRTVHKALAEQLEQSCLDGGMPKLLGSGSE